MTIFTLRQKKNNYGEYCVKEIVDGVRREEGCYYTDDWDDALGTFYKLARDLKADRITKEKTGLLWFIKKED